MQRVYRQVMPKRSIALNEFNKGLIDFDFSIGGQTVWIPNRSYFRLGLKIEKIVGGGAPTKADDVAFANYCAGNLFDNCFFMAGGQNVSSITNYSAQAHAASYRLKKSGAWLNTVGKDAYGINPSYTYRKNQVATDGEWMIDSATNVDPGNIPEPDEHSMNCVYMMYAPPLGIMEHSKPMASGDYRFQFNPASNFETAGLESKTGADDFKLVVQSMELYICTEKQEVSPTGTETLHLMEHQIQSKPLTGNENMLDFTVPSSTKAISIFVQSGGAGSTTEMPPSRFCCVGEQERSLKSVQITYANITKPPTRWSSVYSNNERKLQQRYLDTQIESSQAFSPGGCQTLQQWIDDGVLLHYSWVHDANDRSTQLQLAIDYINVEARANIFVIAHYTKSVEIQVSNGFVSSVTSVVI